MNSEFSLICPQCSQRHSKTADAHCLPDRFDWCDTCDAVVASTKSVKLVRVVRMIEYLEVYDVPSEVEPADVAADHLEFCDGTENWESGDYVDAEPFRVDEE